MSFTLATWNINSVRLRAPIVARLLADEKPDILCLQECKCLAEQIPHETFRALGYNWMVARGQKSYNGVAILSRLPISDAGGEDFAALGHARHVAARLDSDGSDLSIADAYVLGGDSTYTWSEADSAFSPGRLDYALYPDSELEVANSFVLDVARFRAEAAGKAGLEGEDFKASDHRPLVIDLVRRKATVAAPAVEDLTTQDLLAKLSDRSAEVTLVNFWATWCRPCVAELPDLIRVTKSAPAGSVRLVLVSFDDPKDRAKASQLLGKLGVDFPTFLKKGTDQEFLDEIDPSWEGTLPLTLAYNRAGKLVARHQNQATADEFIQLIESARRGSDSK